jgi:exodeoxyribonuclease I
MTQPTFYWYDYETFGADPARDRPAQFAGLRTDLEMNPLGKPLVLYCKPAPDYLPDPAACLITGITPQQALDEGVLEVDFIRTIHAEFSVPGTCVVGYNNIRFDDEVTRYALYRNLMDPYAREWRNGNSRWDLIDVMRMARALRPEGIEWPIDPDGRVSFRLDQLTAVNNIQHADAHDALSDVMATMDLARLLKQKQPRFFDFMMTHRHKQQALKLLGLGSLQPLIHASSRYPAAQGCMAVVVALARHPGNPNGIVTYDLSVDPDPLIELSPAILHERLFTPRASLPADIERIALKTVHINKCPALAPLSTLQPERAEIWGLDLDQCKKNLEKIRRVEGLDQKIQAILSMDNRDKGTAEDVDLSLYDGFVAEQDRTALNEFLRLSPAEMAGWSRPMSDPRLPELMFRFRARNYPDSLKPSETERWRLQTRNCLSDKALGGGRTFYELDQSIAELANQPLSEAKLRVLDAVKAYANQLRLA